MTFYEKKMLKNEFDIVIVSLTLFISRLVQPDLVRVGQ